jgi:hypothetical protein
MGIICVEIGDSHDNAGVFDFVLSCSINMHADAAYYTGFY